jgi:hypothetical protein
VLKTQEATQDTSTETKELVFIWLNTQRFWDMTTVRVELRDKRGRTDMVKMLEAVVRKERESNKKAVS